MIDKNLTYAVIGASQNAEKYGFKVFKDLLDASYKVIPVNPKGGELLGEKVWPSILDYQPAIDVAIFVIPPTAALSTLKEIVIKKIGKVWFQPGSESDEAIKFCKNNNIECISKACIMIEKTSKSGKSFGLK